MVIILFDNNNRKSLYPFTQTKAVADLRCGIFTVKERWELISGFPVYINTENYLSVLYDETPQDECLFIDASLKDEDTLRTNILSLSTGEALYDEFGLIAGRIDVTNNDFDINHSKQNFNKITLLDNVTRLEFPWQIFQWNDEQLRKDFLLLFSRTTTQQISETNKVTQPENIIIEEGATIEHCILNASTGPIYIGKNATIMEGSMLRGPIAICENATVKMGAKLYGATTISPFCTVGGEIKNSLLQSFSNKAHDGYLGDSVIGRWCNFGAGTSNSNIKNTAAKIIAHPLSSTQINSNKCGMIMGDYSRTAINTSINTATTIGICCNVFGEGLTPKFIDDFTWGKNEKYKIDKAIEHIKNWKQLKGKEFSEHEMSVLKYIFDQQEKPL